MKAEPDIRILRQSGAICLAKPAVSLVWLGLGKGTLTQWGLVGS